jgi:ABC-type transporter Mla subunit MlaD
LDFIVTFRDAKGLQPGQAVVYKGIRIGEVRSVDIEPSGTVRIGVRVSRRYRDSVCREAAFLIENPRGWLDTSVERQITVTDRGGSRTPIRGGDIIEGSDGPLGQLLEQAKALGAAAMETAQKIGQEMSASVQTAASSPEAQQLGAELQRYGTEAARLSREGYEKFRREQLPRLKEEAKRLEKQLEDAGKSQEARKLREEFERWLKAIEG